ncbi:thymidine kinase [Actinokineospora sp. NBRC 105648]|uniref:thymidine kinase n=1 Tax=Actinokineospora sp. NBRC 105648 TaxID=3032206 RepID=UPI002555D431|nr:thymidine kinase [Actinokineospora sp. NBRC 105648]
MTLRVPRARVEARGGGARFGERVLVRMVEWAILLGQVRPRSLVGPARGEPLAKLYFYYSAMNAGKTTTLLQSAYNYHERSMTTLIFTPRVNDRDGEGMVVSRIGLAAPGRVFDPAEDLFEVVAAGVKPHCVLVDEAQFLTKAQVWQLSDVVDRLGIPVLAYGLRTDFRGELFEGSQYLLAWADSLVEIKTICHTGRKATMTVRTDAFGNAVAGGPQIEIGGDERYMSVTRQEYKRLTGGVGGERVRFPGEAIAPAPE